MEFLEKIKERWQTIFVVTILITGIVFSVSAFLTPQYGSKISILVIQSQPNDKVDAYSAAKSAEYLSDILAKVIYSDSFMQKILEAPSGAELNLPSGAEDKKEYWRKKIDVKRINNTGIIEVTAFDRDRTNAEKIAEAISWAYGVKGNEYHGGGDRVRIEKIDGPITSTNPAKPNILLNTLLGIIIGLIGAVSLIYFFEDFELRIFGRKKSDFGNLDLEKQNQIQADILKNGLANFRKQFQGYESFDEYVFDGQKKEEEKKLEDETLRTVEPIENKEEIALEKNEEQSVLNFSEEKELSFEDVVVKDERIVSSANKAGAPQNLPFFEGDLSSLINSKEENKINEAPIDKTAENSYNSEPTEEEVKEKLNKLLRGEM